ncbi:hypothetical protein RJ639_012094 [Escallonia herrerae]|uniref:BRCT domain-containing protein n=1 Tax=Escallonia herrerae TaxID=1293975 RepID=A0AA89AT30_9ASTE|nr:hypothetical protein RJ639_012094 [Escallonia herrerae]
MSSSNSSPKNGGNRTTKRNLPSWMSSRANADKTDANKPADVGRHNGSEEAKSRGKSHTSSSGKSSGSKPLEGVMFVLSGFVNPERSVLRSQALELGAEYQADWNSDCTLLDWISECYNQKSLWILKVTLCMLVNRGGSISHEACQVADKEPLAARKSQNQVESEAHPKPTTASSSKFSSFKLKCLSWFIYSPIKQPDPSDIKMIAVEGILTCLQDAIDTVKQERDIQQMTEQWNYIPRVVEELAKLEATGDGSTSLTKKNLYRQAMACKQIYEVEFGRLNDASVKNKKHKTGGGKMGENESNEVAGGDSDETIEMTTQKEIDRAYDRVVSELRNC